jgi:apolipoprotein N-acyltransferase
VQQIFTDKNGSVYGNGTMAVQIPLPSEKRTPTFYNRHGDWFGWSCVAIATGILLFRLKQFFICIIHKRGG